MTFEWWFAYLLTSIILSLSPGSGAINTMTTSINHGYRGAAASIAGLQTGLAIHIVLVGIGLGTLFSRSVLAFEVLLNATSLFNHADIRIPPRLDAWLRRLVVTPDMHRTHHSEVRAETDSCFGFCLPWWDHLFGT